MTRRFGGTGRGLTGRHVVIVAMTANVVASDRTACEEAGMDDFLAKPTRLESLSNVLVRWLPVGAAR